MRRQAIVLIALSVVWVTSCGTPDEVHVKNYRFFMDETINSATKSLFQDFFDSFNQAVGKDSLEMVSAPSEANSIIKIKSGIEQETGKIGFGQARTEATSSSAPRFGNGQILVQHSMSLQFDYEFVADRVEQPPGSDEYRALYLLFSHEVGHGMQLGHSDNLEDLMYPAIDSQRFIRIQTFYQKIRHFLEN